MKRNKGKIIGEIIACLFLLVYTGCKKTDNYYGQLSNTPEIYTSLKLDYSRDDRGVGRQYHVGDTLRINGRFNAAPSQVNVQIGKGDATVIGIDRTDSITNADQVTYNKSVETIRIVLTAAMGTGRLSVKVNCRGYTLEGPLLFLVPKGNLPPVTDTLVWKQQLCFQAFSNIASNPLIDSFLAHPVFYPSYSGTGNVFFSKKSKIQLLRPDGNIVPVTDLQNLSDARGPFSIIKMYNGAVDQQEHTLYFSALTSDHYKTPGTPGPAADADSNWIFRYCKLDMQTKLLQVVNRTIVPIYQNSVNALGSSIQLQTLYTGEGQASQVNLLPFSQAWADNQGDVYFTPIGLVFNRWGFDATGRVSAYPQVYNGTLYLLNGYNYLGKITPDGKVQYLMKTRNDWPGGGAIKNTILSLDPVKGIMFTKASIGGNLQITLYDLNSRSIISQLYPTIMGGGPTGPFNLLDAMTPASNATYSALGGENGRLAPLPGSANRFLDDLAGIVYDFTGQQAYYYAPVIKDSIGFRAPAGAYDQFTGTREDLPAILLNYDQQGNLYRIAPFYKVLLPAYAFYYDVRRTYALKH
ncbi:hypothetical protein [Chitinophaga vietnamensis]|uniref:hypothetical protein n=1 Tax=Chitinophaga vietnamensis TaxID=2593957 RepID=UPI001177A5EF|nr:hypothetical protein [Chitinophaga vietnamensis]